MSALRYHDFHLTGYDVRKSGSEIVLHLLYDYPSCPREESHIRFQSVELYHFVHTGGAIILDIVETPLSQVFQEFGDRIQVWANQFGIQHWDYADPASYQRKLEAQGLCAWEISSSIGFAGFVIAKSIEDVTDQFAQPTQ